MSNLPNRFFGVINANPTQVLVQWIVQRNLQRLIPRYVRGRLIDIGCGTKPYADLLAPYATEHVGVDLSSTASEKSNIDILCNAYKIPVKSESFDCALCTAVLEHLEEPEEAIRECYRLLKTDGVALYSIPFIWHLHEEPRDFFRFSKYGIEYLFKKSGFEISELIALSGFWVTFGQLFVYNLQRMNRGPLRWLRIIDLLGILIQLISYGLDRFDRTEQWTWMYILVAKKR
jgi:SAM-dependent methyltransferase